MVVERPQLLDLRRVRAGRLASRRHILPVLAAAGIGTVGRDKQRERPLNSVRRHRLHGIRQQRAPVAVAPVNGQADAVLPQLRFEGRNQRADLRVDRADAAEMVVVFGDFQHSLARHIAPAEHILQKRHDVIGTFRTAECHNQNRIVICRHSVSAADVS